MWSPYKLVNILATTVSGHPGHEPGLNRYYSDNYKSLRLHLVLSTSIGAISLNILSNFSYSSNYVSNGSIEIHFFGQALAQTPQPLQSIGDT